MYLRNNGEIGKRLEKAIMDLRIRSARQLALSIGMDASFLSKVLKGEVAISDKYVELLKKKHGLNPDWLLNGNGEEFGINVPHETSTEENAEDSNNGSDSYLKKRRDEKNVSKPFMVPLIPVKAQAGYVKNYDNTDYINQLETHAIVPGIDPRGTTWRYFEIEGDSMQDALNERDVVLCNFVPDFDWHDIKDNLVYVIITEESVIIKRVVKKSPEEWILKSDNRQYPRRIIKLPEIKEVWKARRVIGGDLGPVKKTKNYELD